MARRLLILVTTLATIGIANAQDADDPTTESVAAPVTLTCSARLPTTVTGCFLERLLWAAGPLEVAMGVDGQVSFTDAAQGHVAPYAVVSWFERDWAAWVEVRLPQLAGVPVVGDADWLRVGFTVRFTP